MEDPIEIIDFHCHVFPPEFITKRDALIKDDKGFRVLYQNPKARLVTAEGLLSIMDGEGIKRAVVFGFPWEKKEYYRVHNDYVAQAVSRYPERFLGLASFLPCLGPGEMEAEAQRCLENGLQGVGELAWYGGDFDQPFLDGLRGVMDMLRERGKLAMFHTNEPFGHAYPGKAPMTLEGIFRLVNTFSDNRLVLAHWGGGIFFYMLLKKEMRESFKNVWFDTAASPFLYSKGIYRVALEILGKGKILFGSDYPLLPPKRYLEEIHGLGLMKEDVEAILEKNARNLLGLLEG